MCDVDMVQLLTSIPEEEVNQFDKKVARRLTNLVVNSKSIEADDPNQVVVRDILPANDLNSGGENGWNGTDENWVQDWSSDGAGTDAYAESYEIDSNNNAEGKIVAFHKINIPSGESADTRQVRFGVGKGGNQGTKAWVNIEEAEQDSEGAGVFSQAVIYGPTQNGNIEQYIKNTTDGNRLQFLGFVAEPIGETLSVPSNPIVDATVPEAAQR